MIGRQFIASINTLGSACAAPSTPETNACLRCGGRTYTWGDPLPGQAIPSKGVFDQRERSNRTCVSCGYTWRSR